MLAVWGPNTSLALGSIVVLFVGSALLWRPGEPPVLLLVFTFQWLQASTLVFLSNVRGVSLQEADPWGGATSATVLALLGLVTLAAGIRTAAGQSFEGLHTLTILQVQRSPKHVWFTAYVGAIALTWFATVLIELIPGLRQPLLVVQEIKWAAFFLFTFATFSRPTMGGRLWLAAFLFEFMLGIGGYFSAFRSVFIFSFLGLIAARYRLRRRTLALALVLVLIGLLVTVSWMAVRSEYRQYVSGGEQSQAVTVDYSSRVKKLVELGGDLRAADMSYALTSLFERIAYVHYFGAATTFVPARRPHEGGALLLDALIRPVIPRLFFPDKPAIDESTLVRKYTGLRVAGMEEGTQISMGFVAESYVDFGRIGMMICLFCWGLFLGAVYRWLLRGKYSRGVLGLGEAAAVLLAAASIEVSSAKLFGGITTAVLVLFVFNRVVVPSFLPWLQPTWSGRAVAEGP